MAKFKVIIQGAPQGPSDLPSNVYGPEMEALGPVGAEIVEVKASSEDEFIVHARDADAIIVGGRRISEKIIGALGKCKVIATGSVGVDGIDMPAATAKGIPVVNVPDTFVDEVAEHTVTLLLAAHRRVRTMDRMVRDGRWGEGRPMLSRYPRLLGQTLGFISFGNIPRAVAARMKPFGVHMLAYDPFIRETSIIEHGVEPVGLTELLQRSDIVSMHAPNAPGTHHMLNEERFRLMKPQALLVNTGRGPTVDEVALIRALKEGWIAGAGLDVLEKEPPDSENPLLKMDNVVLSPHVASASARMRPEARRRVGSEIALVLAGRWPISCVNPSVLEKSGLRRWQAY